VTFSLHNFIQLLLACDAVSIIVALRRYCRDVGP